MVTTIVKDRPLSIAQAKEVIDTGLITANKAKELGLIDRVAYSDALRDELAETYEAEPLVFVKNYGKKEVDTDFSGPMGLVKLMQVMMGGSSSSKPTASGKKIAVVYAVGPIIDRQERERHVRRRRSWARPRSSKRSAKPTTTSKSSAIVLRIDSPGGSALASDLIWHETQVIKKPIVASMGDVAASGGYYIAMGADKIIAAPGTITGSIGVVGGKMAIRGLYDKVGITTETIERGKNSGLFSSSGKFTDSQREVVKKMMEDTYGQFTDEGRRGPQDAGRKAPRAGRRPRLHRPPGQGKRPGRRARHAARRHRRSQEAGRPRQRMPTCKIEVLPEPTNFFESLFGDLEAEKEVRIGTGFGKLAIELVNVARRAARWSSSINRRRWSCRLSWKFARLCRRCNDRSRRFSSATYSVRLDLPTPSDSV